MANSAPDGDSEEIDIGLDSIFPEPPRPPTPEATFSVYNGRHKDFRIRLVGSHPLWGHHLWNSALSLASYLEEHTELCSNANILELGAGGALPSLVAAECGAQKVVITDYPDTDLVKNIELNVRENVDGLKSDRVGVMGYIWGQNTSPLLDMLPAASSGGQGFDIVILSDLIFNHSQHDALLKTCQLALKPPKDSYASSSTKIADAENTSIRPPCVLVFYTHHRPHLAHRDMGFFEKARAQGWDCVEVVTQKFEPMFPEDPGEKEVRATVHGWYLTRRNDRESSTD